MEAVKLRKYVPNHLAVIVNSTGVIGLLEGLVWLTSAHVRALHGREQGDVTKIIDLLLVLCLSFLGRVDVFDATTFHQLDHVRDPSPLYFHGGWAFESSVGP